MKAIRAGEAIFAGVALLAGAALPAGEAILAGAKYSGTKVQSHKCNQSSNLATTGGGLASYWRPTEILNARTMKFTITYDF